MNFDGSGRGFAACSTPGQVRSSLWPITKNPPASRGTTEGLSVTSRYRMTISRLTVDKLGVKLYDRVSAVIAELVANSYDADATEVEIARPNGRVPGYQDRRGDFR